MSKPRAITIFLHDGDPEGIRTAQSMLSTIFLIAFKKMQFKETKTFYSDLTSPGVYILVGFDDENPDKPDQMVAYIGESENVAERLKTHIQQKQKPFWTDTLVVVSKDDSLTKSHARYVEARLISDAGQNPKWKLANKQETKEEGKLPHPDRMVMDEFIEISKTLVGAMGYDLFRVTSGRLTAPFKGNGDAVPSGEPSPMFAMSGSGYSARMLRDASGKFIVVKGSRAKLQNSEKCPQTALLLREGLKEKGFIAEVNGALEFLQDYAFSSLSTAAAVVTGYSIAGPTAWKMEPGGMTFRDWENGKLIEEIESDPQYEETSSPSLFDAEVEQANLPN